MIETLLQWDSALFLLFNRHLAVPLLDPFFTFITNGRNWIIPGVLGSLIFCLRGRRHACIIMGLAFLTVALTDPICCKLIKVWVQRLRPCNPSGLIEGGRFLIGHKTSYSFPSAHAMNMFGQAMLFSQFYPRLRLWFMGCAALVAYSRIYVGVHYPLDVLSGAVLGCLVGAGVFAGYRLAGRWYRRERMPDALSVKG